MTDFQQRLTKIVTKAREACRASPQELQAKVNELRAAVDEFDAFVIGDAVERFMGKRERKLRAPKLASLATGGREGFLASPAPTVKVEPSSIVVAVPPAAGGGK